MLVEYCMGYILSLSLRLSTEMLSINNFSNVENDEGKNQFKYSCRYPDSVI